MKARFFILLVIFWGLSCNQVIDPNPVDPGAEPTEAVKVVKGRFPNAKDLVFKVLLTGKIWEVGFNSDKDNYTSLVDQTKMWETFKATPDSIPTVLNDLLLTTSFGGGTLSANSEDVDFYPTVQRHNRAIYNYYSVDYGIDWLKYINDEPADATYDQYRYKIQSWSLSDFPREIRDFFSDNKNLTFQFGEFRILLNYDKHYWVQALFNRDGKDYLGYMLFNGAGALKWTSREFNQPFPDDQVTNVDTLPEPIQKHLDNSPELAKFKYYTSGLDKWRSEYKGISSYYLHLRNRDYSESCQLYFDQDGNLLSKRYYVAF